MTRPALMSKVVPFLPVSPMEDSFLLITTPTLQLRLALASSGGTSAGTTVGGRITTPKGWRGWGASWGQTAAMGSCMG